MKNIGETVISEGSMKDFQIKLCAQINLQVILDCDPTQSAHFRGELEVSP